MERREARTWFITGASRGCGLQWAAVEELTETECRERLENWENMQHLAIGAQG